MYDGISSGQNWGNYHLQERAVSLHIERSSVETCRRRRCQVPRCPDISRVTTCAGTSISTTSHPSPTVLLASFVATSILQPICLRPIIRLVRLKGRVSPAKSSTLYTQQIQSNISMLSELNWQPLAEGRRHGRLVMFYKIHYRLVSICIPLTSKFHLQPTCTENNYVCL